MKNRLFVLILMGAFASGCSRNMVDWSVISEGEIDNWGQTPYDENIILLQHKEDDNRSPFLSGRPLRQAAQVSSLGIQAIHVPEHMTALELIAKLRSTDEYTFVEPNFLPSLPSVTYRPMSTHQIASANSAIAFNDPYESYQWHMDQIQADEVSSSYWGEDIVVAVIDTGVSEGPDGFHSLIGGYDFINSDNDPSDDHGHGTHVAGTVAQQTDNGIGVRGVAPFASIMPLKSLDEDGIGSTLATTQAIEYAVDNGAHVINLSLVSEVSSTPERNAVIYAQEAGVAVIAAAGNDGRTMTGVGYPAAYPESIAVSAVGYNERLTDYSNAGPEIDFAAPGGDVDVDRNGDTYADGVLQETIIDGSFNYYFFEGTSMATPHVAGVYAVLMGAGAS
ncbi:MAG: S8 family serine peptidase, partial [Myxococcota bacterium]|nr:S8 family serine peptidase [Myxococcota bacterium]